MCFWGTAPRVCDPHRKPSVAGEKGPRGEWVKWGCMYANVVIPAILLGVTTRSLSARRLHKFCALRCWLARTNIKGKRAYLGSKKLTRTAAAALKLGFVFRWVEKETASLVWRKFIRLDNHCYHIIYLFSDIVDETFF